MMKKWFLVGLTALSLGISVPSFAQMSPAGSQPAHMHPKHDHMGLDSLGLSADQKKQVHSIMEQTKQSLLALRIEEKKKRLELSQILLSPNPDRSAVNQKIQEMSDLGLRKRQQLADAYFQILPILNPDQRLKFSQLVVKHLTGDEEHEHHGFGGPMHRH